MESSKDASMLSSRSNPYVVAGPVTPPGPFFGREELLRYFPDRLRPASCRLILLQGPRRIGKTSFLLHLAARLREPFMGLYVDLNGRATQPFPLFVRDLADDIVVRTGGKAAQRRRLEDVGQAHRRLLEALRAAGAGRRLVLLFDEFDVPAAPLSPDAAGVRLFPYLQELSALEGGPAFVLAHGRSREFLSRTAHLGLFQGAPVKKLSVLSQPSARQLVVDLSEGHCVYHELAIRSVLELTGRHPFLLQLLAGELFDMPRRRPLDPLGLLEVMACVPRALENGQTGLQWMWEGLSDAERGLASAIALASPLDRPISFLELRDFLLARDTALTEAQLQELLRGLEEVEFVRRESAGRLSCASDLLRRWIVQAHPPALARTVESPADSSAGSRPPASGIDELLGDEGGLVESLEGKSARGIERLLQERPASPRRASGSTVTRSFSTADAPSGGWQLKPSEGSLYTPGPRITDRIREALRLDPLGQLSDSEQDDDERDEEDLLEPREPQWIERTPSGLEPWSAVAAVAGSAEPPIADAPRSLAHVSAVGSDFGQVSEDRIALTGPASEPARQETDDASPISAELKPGSIAARVPTADALLEANDVELIEDSELELEVWSTGNQGARAERETDIGSVEELWSSAELLMASGQLPGMGGPSMRDGHRQPLLTPFAPPPLRQEVPLEPHPPPPEVADDMTPLPLFQRLMQIGHEAFVQNELEASITAYHQALKLEPGRTEAVVGLAQALTEALRFQEAVEALQSIARTSPDAFHETLSDVYLRWLDEVEGDDEAFARVVDEGLRALPDHEQLRRRQRGARLMRIKMLLAGGRPVEAAAALGALGPELAEALPEVLLPLLDTLENLTRRHQPDAGPLFSLLRQILPEPRYAWQRYLTPLIEEAERAERYSLERAADLLHRAEAAIMAAGPDSIAAPEVLRERLEAGLRRLNDLQQRADEAQLTGLLIAGDLDQAEAWLEELLMRRRAPHLEDRLRSIRAQRQLITRFNEAMLHRHQKAYGEAQRLLSLVLGESPNFVGPDGRSAVQLLDEVTLLKLGQPAVPAPRRPIWPRVVGAVAVSCLVAGFALWRWSPLDGRRSEGTRIARVPATTAPVAGTAPGVPVQAINAGVPATTATAAVAVPVVQAEEAADVRLPANTALSPAPAFPPHSRSGNVEATGKAAAGSSTVSDVVEPATASSTPPGRVRPGAGSSASAGASNAAARSAAAPTARIPRTETAQPALKAGVVPTRAARALPAKAGRTPGGPGETAGRSPQRGASRPAPPASAAAEQVAPPPVPSPASDTLADVPFDAYQAGLEAARAGRLDEAFAAYRQALAENPNRAEVYLELGDLYTQQGRGMNALNAYKKAVQLNPRLTRAYYALGRLHQTQGHQEEAIAAYQTVTQQDRGSLGIEARKRLEQLRLRSRPPALWSDSAAEPQPIPLFNGEEKKEP